MTKEEVTLYLRDLKKFSIDDLKALSGKVERAIERKSEEENKRKKKAFLERAEEYKKKYKNLIENCVIGKAFYRDNGGYSFEIIIPSEYGYVIDRTGTERISISAKRYDYRNNSLDFKGSNYSHYDSIRAGLSLEIITEDLIALNYGGYEYYPMSKEVQDKFFDSAAKKVQETLNLISKEKDFFNGSLMDKEIIKKEISRFDKMESLDELTKEEVKSIRGGQNK